MTVGEEGFFAPGDPHVSANPGGSGSGWSSATGQVRLGGSLGSSVQHGSHLSALASRVRILQDSCTACLRVSTAFVLCALAAVPGLDLSNMTFAKNTKRCSFEMVYNKELGEYMRFVYCPSSWCYSIA